MCASPTGTTITTIFFSKNKTKQDAVDFFWGIFGPLSLLKLEKYVEADNHYSVLQINIISSRKCYDLTSIGSNKHSTSLHVLANCHKKCTV